MSQANGVDVYRQGASTFRDHSHRIEEVKVQYAQQLEALRAAVQSRLGIHQFRYQREFEMLLPLSEKLVELRDATLSLRPETEYFDPNEAEEDRKKRKLHGILPRHETCTTSQR